MRAGCAYVSASSHAAIDYPTSCEGTSTDGSRGQWRTWTAHRDGRETRWNKTHRESEATTAERLSADTRRALPQMPKSRARWPGTLRACHPLRVFQFVPAPMRRARARPVRNPRGRQPAPLHHPPCRCCPVAPPRCVEPAELRSLHWRAPERYGELLLHHRENLSSRRPRILARDHPTRRELRHLQLSRDPHAPRAHLLGAVPVQSSWDPARDRMVDSFKQRSWLAGA